MTDIKVLPEEIIFDISKLKFTALNEAGNRLFDYSLLGTRSKIEIETLPPGVLPDKMVINLRQINSDVTKLNVILKIYKNKLDLSEFIDVGNDIEYAMKELPKFKKRLKLLVNDAAAKMTNDMFGNVYAGFGKYKYIELLFSKDYKNIISIRLLGPSREKTPKRFVMFNIPNENLDINIINLIYKSKNILKEHKNPIVEESANNAYNFINKNFVPIPPFHKKPSLLPAPWGNMESYIEDLIKDISPKTYDALLKSNNNFQSLSTKQQMFDISQRLSTLRTFQDSSLTKSIPSADSMKGIKDGFANPLECIAFLWNNMFANFLSCEFLQEIAKMLAKIGLDMAADQFNAMSLVPLFEAIDALPSMVRALVYLNMNNEQLGLNIDNALMKVQDYIASLPQPQKVLKCQDPTSLLERFYGDSTGTVTAEFKLSSIFKDLKQDYPDQYSDIEKVFNENYSRQALTFILKTLSDLLLAIDYCNFSLNFDFKLPTLKIPDLWFDFSFNIEKIIFGLICELLSQIFELLINMLMSINKFDEFFEQFMGEENLDAWSQYVDYAFYLLISSSRSSTTQHGLDQNSLQRREQSSNFYRSSIAPLMTQEGKAAIQSKAASTMNPMNQEAACKDISFSALNRTFNDDISFDIPNPEIEMKILSSGGYSSRHERRIAALKMPIGTATKLQQLQQVNQETIEEILEKIKHFTYCKKYDFFANSGIIDPGSLEVLKEVSNNSPQLYESDLISNAPTPNNKEHMSESLKNMFLQIQSVLSPRELTSLILGTYTEEVASVVRIIAKINFPNLTNNLDPIKYFTMLGKVVGTTMQQLKDSGAFK